MTILSEIFAHKRLEVAEQKQRVSTAELREQIETVRPPLDFVSALRRSPTTPVVDPALRRSSTTAVVDPTLRRSPTTAVVDPALRRSPTTPVVDPKSGDFGLQYFGLQYPALIAEIKKGSPSQGIMVQDFDPLLLAQTYAANGAAAISVLTDQKYFGGSLDYLKQIADLNLGRPLLRKEFICDLYQIYEARAGGADAVLLIVAELSDHQLLVFQSLTRQLGMAALVEVHTAPELIRALRCEATLIGINNRNLHDFSVSLETTRRLRPIIPAPLTVVAESGISSPSDFADLPVNAVLVGEALVRAEDIGAKVRELAGVI